jgi:hypothetical protein
MRVSPTLRLTEKPKPTADFVKVEGNQLKLADAAAISRLELKQPGNWPALSGVTSQLMSFKMPDTGGSGSAGGRVALQVNNPDGMVSNSREGTILQILEVPFTFGVHNLFFGNFTDDVPD